MVIGTRANIIDIRSLQDKIIDEHIESMLTLYKSQ